MEKKHFFVRLIPPRPTFAMDMSDEERAMMQQHVVFWKEKLDKGIVIVFGPVFDPGGGYGIGVLEVDDESVVFDLRDNDPAMKSGRGFQYEIHSMRAVRK